MKVDYYECTDSGNLYAEIEGRPGLLMVFDQERETGPWRFLAPGTERYDYHHQKLFRQYRGVPIAPEALPPTLPPVPETPAGPFPTWAENQGQGKTCECSHYPRLTARVDAAGPGGLPVYVVLCEDRYESAFGDGKSLDLDAVAFTREAAEAYIAEQAHNTWDTRSLRSFTLERARGRPRLTSRNYRPDHYEHYALGEVLNRLEALLGDAAVAESGPCSEEPTPGDEP